MAGPILLILDVDRGASYARGAASGAMLGIASLALYCVAYGAVAARWQSISSATVAFLAGLSGFGLGTLGFAFVRPPLAVCTAITLSAAMASGLLLERLVSRTGADRMPAAVGRTSDLLWWRVAITAILVLALTAAAKGLSSHIAGLLVPFPIITSVMAVFTHMHGGALASLRMLAGLVRALYSFIAFFAVVGALLVNVDAGVAFIVASLVSLAVWGVVYRVVAAPAVATA